MRRERTDRTANEGQQEQQWRDFWTVIAEAGTTALNRLPSDHPRAALAARAVRAAREAAELPPLPQLQIARPADRPADATLTALP